MLNCGDFPAPGDTNLDGVIRNFTTVLFDVKAEDISAYATALGVVIASVALCVAAFQIWVTRLETRRSTALQIYKDYLKLAMDNPKFSSASYPIDSPRIHLFDNDDLEFERYEYYVSQVLFAAEGILEITNDLKWHAALLDQLKYHALYLKNATLVEAHFSKEIVALSKKSNC